MTTSLKKQFADLQANAYERGTPALGARLAHITIQASLQYKPEYLIYVMRYGPPVRGIFDPVYIELIRAELLAGTI
jgi:hypothetical protein